MYNCQSDHIVTAVIVSIVSNQRSCSEVGKTGRESLGNVATLIICHLYESLID